MKLSKQTIDVLKNFSEINQGIVIAKGNHIKTISSMQTILASATIVDEFPRDFAIYNIPELLNTISMMGSPNLEFDSAYININSDAYNVKYYYSSPDVIIVPPEKKLELKEFDTSFELTETHLTKLRQASNVMRLTSLNVTKQGFSLQSVSGSENQYTIDIDVKVAENSNPVTIDINDLKIIPATYKVEINSTRGLMRMTSEHEGISLEYFIAIQA